MEPPLEPVKVPLEGIPFLWWVICTTQLGVISKFAEAPLHSVSEGLKAECPPSDLGAANISGREERIVSTSTLMQKTRCCCWVGFKFVLCISLPVLGCVSPHSSLSWKFQLESTVLAAFSAAIHSRHYNFIYIFILLLSTWLV